MNTIFRKTLFGAAILSILAYPAIAAPFDIKQEKSRIVYVSANTKNFIGPKPLVSKMGELAHDDITGNNGKKKYEDLIEFFARNSDCRHMTSLSAGRAWREMTPTERFQASILTCEIIPIKYLQHVSIYGQSSLEVVSTSQDDDGTVIVTSFIMSDDIQRSKIEWHLTKQNSYYRITNIVIDRRSIMLDLRTKYTEKTGLSGIGGLIQFLSIETMKFRSELN